MHAATAPMSRRLTTLTRVLARLVSRAPRSARKTLVKRCGRKTHCGIRRVPRVAGAAAGCCRALKENTRVAPSPVGAGAAWAAAVGDFGAAIEFYASESF